MAARDSRPGQGFRWRLAEDDGGQPALFADEELFDRHVGIGEYRGLEFLHVNAKRIINPVPGGSRMGFRYTINAYRGCSHSCKFCFARPTHEYLNLNTGEDFERKIVVKVNAVEKVRAELRASRWNGELIAMGTNTDPYQRAEGKYHLTRGIVQALGQARNPFSILTKGTLILRDLDLLTEAAARTEVRCAFSIGTLDEEACPARSKPCGVSTRRASRRRCSSPPSSRDGPTAPNSWRRWPAPASTPAPPRSRPSPSISVRG